MSVGSNIVQRWVFDANCQTFDLASLKPGTNWKTFKNPLKKTHFLMAEFGDTVVSVFCRTGAKYRITFTFVPNAGVIHVDSPQSMKAFHFSQMRVTINPLTNTYFNNKLIHNIIRACSHTKILTK